MLNFQSRELAEDCGAALVPGLEGATSINTRTGVNTC
jgi:hypothetical protein